MGKIKKALIVQPHSDDALFSCAHPILSEEYEVQILTIENNPKRIKEDGALYELLNIKMHCLNVNFNDESYYDYFKKHKEIKHEEALGFLDEYFGEERLKEIEKSLLSFLKKFFIKHPDYKIIAPLGIGHPFHYFIHDLLKNVADLFYREFPHSYKKRSQPQMISCLDDYELYKLVDVRDIHDIKFELAKKYYKTQSGLLFFEQGYIKKCLPEELYKRKAK